MTPIRKGDLIYIPSSVRLYNEDEFGTTKDFITIDEPINLLVVKINEKTYEVLHNERSWFVNKREVYGVTQ